VSLKSRTVREGQVPAEHSDLSNRKKDVNRKMSRQLANLATSRSGNRLDLSDVAKSTRAAHYRQPHLLPQQHAAMQIGDPSKAGIAQDDRGLAGTHAGMAHGYHRLVLGNFPQAVRQFV
jgi:hypothetical protein